MIERIALRGWDAELVDEEDIAEQFRIRYVLQKGMLPLLLTTVRALLSRPWHFLKTLLLVVTAGCRADRPFPYHLVCLAEDCLVLQWLR